MSIRLFSPRREGRAGSSAGPCRLRRRGFFWRAAVPSPAPSEGCVCSSDIFSLMLSTRRAAAGRAWVRGAGFRDVERFAFRNTFRDVEKNDVAEFLHGCQMGERAADLACADKSNLGSGHGSSPVSVPISAVA